MDSKNDKHSLYYILIFILALSVRTINLDLIPLSEYEAGWAIRAFGVFQGDAVELGSQPAYVILTGFLFSIFGSSDALARFLPALLGSMLVWLPFSIRKTLGTPTALIFALGLALDPGMVAVSRLAGGPMLGLGFAVLAFIAWKNGQSSRLGIWLILAIMSHPGVLGGLLALLLVWGLYKSNVSNKFKLPRVELVPSLTAAGVTILLAGTYLLRYPDGITGIGSAIGQYFSGWFTLNQVSFWEVGSALLIYQPLALGFGMVAIWRAWKEDNPLGKLLGLWFGVSFLMTLSYPSHQVSDLVWVLLPLWGLASIEIPRHFELEDGKVPDLTWANMGLTFLFAAFFLLNLSYIARNPAPVGYVFQENLADFFVEGQNQYYKNLTVRYLIVFFIPVIAGLSSVLIGVGWTRRHASQGFTWGIGLFLGLYILGVSFSGAFLPKRAINDLWWPGPSPGLTDQLQSTVGDFAELNFGDRQSMAVSYRHDSPLVAWVLRDFVGNEYIEDIPQNAQLPSYTAVVAPSDFISPLLETVYVGQDFALNRYRTLFSDENANFLQWLIFRDIPTANEKVIFWVRADLFPEGALIQGGE